MMKENLDKQPQKIRQMFGKIAPRYDLLNRLMTFGQDMGWRREAISRLNLESGDIVLDIATGTGDIALQILKEYPGTQVIGCDFTPEMLWIAQKRPGGEAIFWVIADANWLPFANECVDGVTSGYLLRNTASLSRTLEEHLRVLTPGRSFSSLDTTPPPENLLKPWIKLYLRVIIPLLGRLVSGEEDAYQYLSKSTVAFWSAEEIAEMIRRAGFTMVGFTRKMLGTMAIHWGRKPERENQVSASPTAKSRL